MITDIIYGVKRVWVRNERRGRSGLSRKQAQERQFHMNETKRVHILRISGQAHASRRPSTYISSQLLGSKGANAALKAVASALSSSSDS